MPSIRSLARTKRQLPRFETAEELRRVLDINAEYKLHKLDQWYIERRSNQSQVSVSQFLKASAEAEQFYKDVEKQWYGDKQEPTSQLATEKRRNRHAGLDVPTNTAIIRFLKLFTGERLFALEFQTHIDDSMMEYAQAIASNRMRLARWRKVQLHLRLVAALLARIPYGIGGLVLDAIGSVADR